VVRAQANVASAFHPIDDARRTRSSKVVDNKLIRIVTRVIARLEPFIAGHHVVAPHRGRVAEMQNGVGRAALTTHAERGGSRVVVHSAIIIIASSVAIVVVVVEFDASEDICTNRIAIAKRQASAIQGRG
jgi:hypothetical protein